MELFWRKEKKKLSNRFIKLEEIPMLQNSIEKINHRGQKQKRRRSIGDEKIGKKRFNAQR